MERTFIVISGLPSSGKTTLGRQLAARMCLTMLDKDDILDALLDSLWTAWAPPTPPTGSR